ncbi:hypothetical protein ECEPECA12_1213 [Escherichia coli EPECa12]|nr:hypothetical protein ECEPECA12_1213 [Escherichia coli EPECa12]
MVTLWGNYEGISQCAAFFAWLSSSKINKPVNLPPVMP